MVGIPFARFAIPTPLVFGNRHSREFLESTVACSHPMHVFFLNAAFAAPKLQRRAANRPLDTSS
jgi:hypothetical protein